MPARYRRPTNRLRSARRRVAWCNLGFSGVNIAAGGNNVFDLLTEFRAAGHEVPGTTVMTMLIQISFPATAAAAWPWGVQVVRLSDIANAVNARPDPGNSLDWEQDWMVLRQDPPNYSGAALDAVFNVNMHLKSRRRIHDAGLTAAMCIHNPLGAAAAPSGFVRTLLQLP